MRSKAVRSFRVSSPFNRSLDHSRLRIPFTLQKHNTWITTHTQMRGSKHIHSPVTLFPSPAWLNSKSFQFVKASLQRDMHQNNFFVWDLFLLAWKRCFSLLAWCKRGVGGWGWHLLCSHSKHMQKIISHLYPIYVLYCIHHTEAQTASGLPNIHFSTRQGSLGGFLRTQIRFQHWRGWS